MIDLDAQLERGEALTNIRAIPGERWFPLETRIEEDFKEYWGVIGAAPRSTPG